MKSPLWPWKWDQDHQHLISSLSCPNIIFLQVWYKSIHWFKRHYGQMEKIQHPSPSMTMTLRSMTLCVCIPILVTTFPEWLSGTKKIAAHPWRHGFVLVVFVVFCVHMYSFAGLIRRTPPPTFSDTAIIDRHSDTTIFQLRAHWVQISSSIGSEKSFGHNMCPQWHLHLSL